MRILNLASTLCFLAISSCDRSMDNYNTANNLYRHGIYEQAHQQCSKIIVDYPESAYADSARILQKYCQYYMLLKDAKNFYVSGVIDSTLSFLNKAKVFTSDSDLLIPRYSMTEYNDMTEKANYLLAKFNLLRSGLQDSKKYLSIYYDVKKINPNSINDFEREQAKEHVSKIKENANLYYKKGQFSNSLRNLIFLFSFDDSLLSYNDKKMVTELKNRIKKIDETRQVQQVMKKGLKSYRDKMICLKILGKDRTIKLLKKSYPNYSWRVLDAIVNNNAIVGMTFKQVKLSLGTPSDIYDFAGKNYSDWEIWYRETGGKPTSSSVYVNMKYPSIGGKILAFMNGKLEHSLSQEIAAGNQIREAMSRYYSSLEHAKDKDAFKYGWTSDIEKEYGITPHEFNSMVDAIISKKQ